MQRNVIQRSYWESGETTPPMPQKRKKTKKEKKSKPVISSPLNVKYVDMMEKPDQLQDQIKYPVEHIATMALEQQQMHSPSTDTLHYVKSLLQRKAKEVLLCITNSTLMVKDCFTKETILQISLSQIMRCHHLQERGSQSNILKIDANDESGPRTHFFQCSKTPAEVICKEIHLAKMNTSTSDTGGKQRKVGVAGQQYSNLEGNWVLQSPSSHPPPPSIAPPPLPTHGVSPMLPTQPPPISASPFTVPKTSVELQGNVKQRGSEEKLSDARWGLPHSYSSYGHAGSERTSSESHNARDIVKQSSSKNTGVFPARSPGEGGEISEMRRRMKASRIQRDVDILNHVMEDLDEFKSILKSKAAAWTELEKKKKKSKRKKHDAALEELRLKAEPPSEEEFKEVYRKCKFALNLIAKLGHHLSAPSASELQAAVFSHYVSHFVSINKGPQLASTVVSPLLTHKALIMLERKLPLTESEIWRQLGANWFLTVETWPEGAPKPPDYEISFTDGCIPPNLHNASDCPANFPTLDTIPREKRENNLEYSEAYDSANQPETESGLMINPAVKAAVESQFPAVTTIPDTLQKKGRQQSSTSQGYTTKATYTYTATTTEELSVHKGEYVEVIDDSRKWWKIKNQHGQIGFVPGNIMEATQGSTLETRIFQNKKASVSPHFSAPSPMSRRSSVSQSGHLGRKQPQQSPLSPVFEEVDSALSQHPPLPPPPSFSPALPHQVYAPPAPPLLPAAGGPPPPPPPPPIIPQKPPMSLNEMISQHKLKSKQEGKTSKASVLQKAKDDNQFDIAEALKTRKPLRKTTKAKLMVDVGSESSGKDGSALLKKSPKINATSEGPDIEYRILPWRADQTAINIWLMQQGYGNCVDKIAGMVKEGSQLYAMDRETLREILGSSDGVRLYSQLQKDKSKSEKEAGIVKETELQKMMRLRKDHLGTGEGEPAPLKLRGPKVISEKETILDYSPGHSRTVNYSSSKKRATSAKHRSKHDYSPDVHVNPKRSFSQRKHASPTKSTNRFREQGFHSDHESSSKKRMQGRPRGKQSDHPSDSSPYSTKERGRRRKKQATNIDDFDETDWSDSRSDSELSYSSDYSENDSAKYAKLRSSASASNLPNATWALNGTEAVDGVESEARVKMQQDEIKVLLSRLRELQKQSNVKVLPVGKQSILQRDLKTLEQIQRKQKDMPGDVTIHTQLIGQQMLLIDHLRESIDLVKEQVRQQQVLAQQQRAVVPQQFLGYPLAHHQLLLESEQQRQQLLLAAAEQQQQLQLAQLAQQQRLLGLHSPSYGFYGSPYSGVTYF